jgi:hypothetical protein
MTFRLDVLAAAAWDDRVATDAAARLRDEPGIRRGQLLTGRP